MASRRKKVVVLEPALNDLKNIHSYLLEFFGDKRAEKVIYSIRTSINNLSTNWNIHSLTNIHHSKFGPIRAKIHFKKYLVLYATDESSVYVIRIWHTARNPEALNLE